MIFDKMCGIVERHIPKVNRLLQSASLFFFEKDPYEDIKDSNYPPDEHFFLPFPIIAVEDPTSCVVLLDETENTVGLEARRVFIECREHKGLILISKGQIKGVKSIDKNGDNHFSGNISSRIEAYDKKKGHLKEFDDKLNYDEEKKSQINLENIATAIEQIHYINTSKSFIVKQTPLNVRKNRDPKKIKRSNQRPIYTLLSINKIHDKMGISISNGSNNSPISHFRRRHFRYLSHEKYSNKGTNQKKIIKNGHRKGQAYYKRVIVPSSWIGESEKIVGNKKYKVILNETS